MAEFADCTIVMLAHNGRQFTEYCLTSLLQANVLPQQMVFINNGSTDDTQDLLDRMAPRFLEAGIDFIHWTNAENLGCSRGRNQGWEKATRKYVVFMDNDTAVCTSDWLHRLIATMDADPTLGVLGPKMIYPFLPHKIQCAGVAVNPLGRIRFRGRGCDRDDPEYAQLTTIPVLISACWIMRPEFLQAVGGLDEFFHPVQYEDLDFCMKVNEAGFHCAYTPGVEIYHFEGKTTGSFGKQVYWRNIVEQSVKFKKRWMHVIKDYPPDDADYRWLDDADLGLTDELDLTIV
jgi:GT2 family glycosyltransferase